MRRHGGQPTFYEVVTAAVRDFAEHGYDSAERLEYWSMQIMEAARRDMISEHVMRDTLNRSMQNIYNRLVERGGLLKQNPGVSRFTLEKVKPKLRAELDRRIMASANLIKLNREAAIQKTLQRFSGWATSIPVGGSDVVNKVETKANVAKALKSLPFEERRVLIDQGHKFAASLSETLANDAGALAGIWFSHWRQRNYNYRKDHKERDGKYYAVRGNWAIEAGFMKPGPDGYVDDITRPSEEIGCRCSYRWITTLRDLPQDMLTEKGKQALAKTRGMVR